MTDALLSEAVSTAIVIETPTTAAAAVTSMARASQDRDGDESADKGNVHGHEKPGEHVATETGTRATLEEVEEHERKRVQDGGGQDALDGAAGVREAADELLDLADADREENQRDERRQELQGAHQALEQGRGADAVEHGGTGDSAGGGVHVAAVVEGGVAFAGVVVGVCVGIRSRRVGWRGVVSWCRRMDGVRHAGSYRMSKLQG